MSMKKVLPLLLATALCAGTVGAVFAEEHPAVTNHEQVVSTHETAPTEHGQLAQAKGKVTDHGGAHTAPMITGEKLKDLLWRTLNFAVLVFLLVKFAGKPMTNSLGSRRKAIADELSALQAQRDEAERSYKDFEARLSGMEQEIELILQRAVALAEDERSRILAEAQESAQDIQRQAEAAVAAAAAAARSSLQNEVAEQAAAMAEQLIKKNLTPADQVILIEQYLKQAGRA